MVKKEKKTDFLKEEKEISQRRKQIFHNEENKR